MFIIWTLQTVINLSHRIDYDRDLTLCTLSSINVTLTDAMSTEQILHEVPGDVIGNEKCSDMWGENLETDMLCFGDGTYGPCLVSIKF